MKKIKDEQEIARLLLIRKYVLSLTIWDHNQDHKWLGDEDSNLD